MPWIAFLTHPSTIRHNEKNVQAPMRAPEQALRRGYTLEATPVPISNTAVKLQRADDTARHTGGKVGRRDVKFNHAPERGRCCTWMYGAVNG